MFYLLFYKEPKFSLVKKWYELFTSCNVFCMEDRQFRNFQIRASLSSPCHYIFRTYTAKNLKETCTLQDPIHCVLYLLWGKFPISEMTSMHGNNTTKKTPCQIQSVHSLGMLIAGNVTLPQLHEFRLRTRCKCELRSFGILRSVDW